LPAELESGGVPFAQEADHLCSRPLEEESVSAPRRVVGALGESFPELGIVPTQLEHIGFELFWERFEHIHEDLNRSSRRTYQQPDDLINPLTPSVPECTPEEPRENASGPSSED